MKDINEVDAIGGATALHWASKAGKYSCVEVRVRVGLGSGLGLGQGYGYG